LEGCEHIEDYCVGVMVTQDRIGLAGPGAFGPGMEQMFDFLL
jgi:hypothetical protein